VHLLTWRVNLSAPIPTDSCLGMHRVTAGAFTLPGGSEDRAGRTTQPPSWAALEVGGLHLAGRRAGGHPHLVTMSPGHHTWAASTLT
jgi:hypothetical protein